MCEDTGENAAQEQSRESFDRAKFRYVPANSRFSLSNNFLFINRLKK
jgi:hypothetical protein